MAPSQCNTSRAVDDGRGGTSDTQKRARSRKKKKETSCADERINTTKKKTMDQTGCVGVTQEIATANDGLLRPMRRRESLPLTPILYMLKYSPGPVFFSAGAVLATAAQRKLMDKTERRKRNVQERAGRGQSSTYIRKHAQGCITFVRYGHGIFFEEGKHQ